METPPPSLKDQGSQALRNGDLDKAVDCLSRAVMMDDHDADAKALLGVAYSQKGLHAQAKRAMESAVERQPQNHNYRFNLGVVLERAGDLQGAVIAYRDTLQANPQHEQAKARLAAMGPQAQALLASAPKPMEPVGVPAYNQPPPDPLGTPVPPPSAPVSPPPPAQSFGGQPGSPFAPPPPPVAGQQRDVPFAPPPTAPLGGSPFAPPPVAPAPVAPQAPPGTVQCPRCGQFSRIGMTCEFCAAPMAPPPRPAAPTPQYGSSTPTYGLGGFGGASLKPHRGTTVLVLGILGILVCGICSIFALIYGNQDLAEMDAGIMDPSGRSPTQTGRVLGMVGVTFMIIGVVINVLVFGSMIASGGR